MIKNCGNAFAELMKIRGKDVSEDEIRFINPESLYQTPFRIGETVAEALGARAVAANDIYELRT